ncbi:MAG TPA: hypothetical protein VL093_09115 [Flavipsychrobacter sp.]|jgi:hypothetical protein|nr:hypothetical protein [Flavipsychrobacter sp.]
MRNSSSNNRPASGTDERNERNEWDEKRSDVNRRDKTLDEEVRSHLRKKEEESRGNKNQRTE